MAKTIIFVAGEGGHFTQFLRLYNGLKDRIVDESIFLLTDTDRGNITSVDEKIKCYNLGAAREKFGWAISSIIKHFLKVVCFFLTLKGRELVLISTGPGIAFIPAVFTKISGGVVIHVETWSRFNSRSLTGRLMYFISDQFYIQNETLQSFYRKAKYSGRL